MALNRWAFEAKHLPGSIHFDTPEALYSGGLLDWEDAGLPLEGVMATPSTGSAR